MSSLIMANSPLPRSAVEINDPYSVQYAIYETRNGLYASIALTTVLIYHSAITFDKEVKYFWAKPCSSISLIYFANRCVGLLNSICSIVYNTFTESAISCSVLYWTYSVAGLITVVLIDHILVIRVLALYDRDRKLAIFLRILLGLEAGVGLGLNVYATHIADPAMGILPEGVTVCGISNDSSRSLIIISWTLQAAYGLLLLALALYKAAEYWRMSAGFKGFHLVRVLVQDQLLYHLLVILCCVLQIAIVAISDINPTVVFALSSIWNTPLLCVLGGQLLINLKEAGERGLNGGTNYTPQSVSDIEFA